VQRSRRIGDVETGGPAPRAGETAAPAASGRRVFAILGTVFEAPSLAPGLYVVATPIGNLADVTLRALQTLAGADRIACEDTRVTAKLLARYGIARPLTAYHDHSGPAERRSLLDRLRAGEAIALASDAGTPLISDPGYRLVAEAVAEGIPVVPVPGPSSLTAALSAAGLPTDAFLFDGFLPQKREARRARLAALANIPATLVLLESPARLAAALADAADILGAERRATVAREVTKLHETFHRGPLGELAASFAAAPARGEIVLVVAPPSEDAAPTEAELDALLAEALSRLSLRDAADAVAEATGRPRRAVYARALALKRAP